MDIKKIRKRIAGKDYVKENIGIINERVKRFKLEGLDLRFVFVFKGDVYFLSTADIFHDSPCVEYYPCRYETMLFKNPTILQDGYIWDLGDEIWSCTNIYEQDAIEEHEKLVKQIKEGTAIEIYKAIERGIE